MLFSAMANLDSVAWRESVTKVATTVAKRTSDAANASQRSLFCFATTALFLVGRVEDMAILFSSLAAPIESQMAVIRSFGVLPKI